MPNWVTSIFTNSTPDSSADSTIDVLRFSNLWSAYPSNRTIEHIDPDTGDDIFGDHCAINVSQSLYKNGIKLKSFRGTKCWRCPTPDEQGRGIHAIRAQELADYLERQPFADCPQPSRLLGETFEREVSGKTGIIFFKDYWRRTENGARTGDHIDLWDGNELASIGAFATFVRTTFSEFSENYLSMSDLKKSSQVLFWEIEQ